MKNLIISACAITLVMLNSANASEVKILEDVEGIVAQGQELAPEDAFSELRETIEVETTKELNASEQKTFKWSFRTATFDSCYIETDGRLECNNKTATAYWICRSLDFAQPTRMTYETRHVPKKSGGYYILKASNDGSKPALVPHRGASVVYEVVCRR